MCWWCCQHCTIMLVNIWTPRCGKRQTHDAPLNSGTKYPASSSLMPSLLAAAIRNVIGRKPPRYVKKLLIARKENVVSLNGLKNSMSSNFRVGGGWRGFRRTFPMATRPRRRNAVLRIAQPKPIRGIRRDTIIGRITPPTDEPETTIPKARARWEEK